MPTQTTPSAQYRANTLAMEIRIAARDARVATARGAVLQALPATVGQLTWGLRANHEACDVLSALAALVGSRSGAETTGVVTIAGYRGGSEVYGMR